jgi:hypothetical protein
MSLTWDDLPGDTAMHFSDMEQTIDRVNRALDGSADGYDLDDLRIDVEEIKDWVIRIEGELSR